MRQFVMHSVITYIVPWKHWVSIASLLQKEQKPSSYFLSCSGCIIFSVNSSWRVTCEINCNSSVALEGSFSKVWVNNLDDVVRDVFYVGLWDLKFLKRQPESQIGGKEFEWHKPSRQGVIKHTELHELDTNAAVHYTGVASFFLLDISTPALCDHIQLLERPFKM